MYELRPARNRREGYKAGKMECKFEEGALLGIDIFTYSYWVADRDGNVRRARTIKQVPEDQQWDADFLKNVKGTPWDPEPDPDEAMNQDLEMDEKEEHEGPPLPPDEEANAQPRGTPAMKITKTMLEKYGYTGSFPACVLIQRGRPGWQQSESCRTRIEDKLAENEQLRARVERSRAERTSHRGMAPFNRETIHAKPDEVHI